MPFGENRRIPASAIAWALFLCYILAHNNRPARCACLNYWEEDWRSAMLKTVKPAEIDLENNL
jgi:hypothetical protein